MVRSLWHEEEYQQGLQDVGASHTIHAIPPSVVLNDVARDGTHKVNTANNAQVEDANAKSTLMDEPHIRNASREKSFPRTSEDWLVMEE